MSKNSISALLLLISASLKTREVACTSPLTMLSVPNFDMRSSMSAPSFPRCAAASTIFSVSFTSGCIMSRSFKTRDVSALGFPMALSSTLSRI